MPRMFNRLSTIGLYIITGSALLALSGCQLDIPKNEHPMLYLLKKTMPPTKTMTKQELLRNLASDDPDLRRLGLLTLGEKRFLDLDTTPKLLKSLALSDPDDLVRATAVEMLCRCPDSFDQIPAYQKTSQDSAPLVRQETLRCLNSMPPHPQALTLLIERLSEDDDSETKAFAAEGLGAYRDRKALEALLGGLTDEAFHVNYRSRQSLIKLTEHDFEYDITKWKEWLDQQNDPFAPFAGEQTAFEMP